MKLVLLGVVIACALTTPLLPQAADHKHLTVATVQGLRPVALTATSIERGAHYPSVMRLKGGVEIRTPVCMPVGPKGALICDGEMILRADEAEFNEDSGEIEARGNVSVTPLHYKSAEK